ncbi:MAG: IPT/TIG domain-containing protein, partial [Deltaproteobacteria bacterium]|nr:IPT/TIG domain-containing protein [Deltaproteobacteria bacterium]
VDVAVTNSDGQSDVLPGGFNYYSAPPVITGSTPTCGPATGGTAIVISARGLRTGVSATVGGLPLTGLVQLDSQTLTGTTAHGTPGPADVVVTNPDGQADTLASGFNFTDTTHPCPNATTTALTLTRVVPGTGPTTGGTIVTLIGQGFLAGATVKFGDTLSTDVRLLGTGALTALLPSTTRVGPVDVTVALPDARSAKITGGFNYFDPTSNLPAPIVSAVAPNAGPNTGASVVQINGQNFAAGARVFFGAAEAQLPTLVDSTRLVAVTPNNVPGPVDVTVLNIDGKSGTLAFGYAYYLTGQAGAPPNASRVDPRTGSTLSPTNASVIGSGFAPGALVFVGGQPASNVKLQGDGSLACTIGQQAPGTVDVIVTNPDGQSTTITGGFTFAPPQPQLTAVAPNFGPLAGGTQVVVSGVGFLSDDLILFGGSVAAVKVLDDSALFATIPQHGEGKVDVALQRGGVIVATLTAAFEYRAGYQPGPPPAIASLEPSTGPTSGGTVLWLTGSNFTAGMQVYFGANPAAKIVLADSGHAVVTAPPGLAGFVEVDVINPDGQAGALQRAFSYVNDALLQGLPPKLTSITPAQGPESSDTVAILTGKNFVNGELVFVGAGRGAGVRLLSSSILNATVPHQPAGTVDVAITHPDGRSSVLTNGFSFLARPTLQSVANSTPGTNAGNSGPTGGGTPVTIAGTGFQPGATVTFARAPATSVQVQSANVLTAVTPAGLAGPADVQLINPDGQTAVLTGGWLYVPPPKATSLLPATGPLTGGTIAVLAGQDFSPQSTVTVGGVQAQVVYGSANSLVVFVPAGATATAVNLTVKNPDGQSFTLPGAFTYSNGPFGPQPTLSSIQPNTGPDTGGSYVQLAGSNFQTGAIAIVGGSQLNRTTIVSSAFATGLTASGPIGPTLVAITNPDGLSASINNGFLYSDHTLLGAAPVVDHAFPNQALAPGGTAIAVIGTGFAPGALVFMQGRPAPTGGGQTTSQINVTTPAADPGVADVAVTNPDGQTSIAPGAFLFLVPPPVFASDTPISPAKGPTSGGNTVTIKGTYFQPPVQVFFGNAAAPIVSASATQLVVTAPPGVAGSVAVLVRNQDGQSASLPGAYYYQSPPVFSFITPTSGPPEGGFTATIHGQYFSGTQSTLKVKFGNADAPLAQPPSATDIVVTVPAETSAGSLTVALTITNDDGQSAIIPGAFIYLPPAPQPTVSGVTPNAGVLGGGNTITVLGANFQYGAKVFFGSSTSSPASPSVNVTSTTALSCIVPAAAVPGLVAITVQNPGTNGLSGSLPDAYTYVSGPAPATLTLTSISPAAGVTAGGTRVLIQGTGFQIGATANLVPSGGEFCDPIACALINVQVLGPTAIAATIPAQPATSLVYHLEVQNPGAATAAPRLNNAWSYGNGTRHFIPQGLRMPMESNNNKGGRGFSGRYSPSWTGVTGAFTRQNQSNVADVFTGGYSGRNPRLMRGDLDPVVPSGKARVFSDFSQYLHNNDGTVVKDNCCGTSNKNYYVFQPRAMDLDGNGWPDVVFWNDAVSNNGALSIFWNDGSAMTNTEYGGSPVNAPPTDWVGGFDLNLDGSPDFVLAQDGRDWVMLGCGGTRGGLPALASPFCQSGSPPTIQTNVAIGTVAVGSNFLSGYRDPNNLTVVMPTSTRWLVDNGANSEIISIVSSTSSGFTATYTKAHTSGFYMTPIVDTVGRTDVTAPGDVVITVDDIWGFGAYGNSNSAYVVDAGTTKEERVLATATYTPAQKKISFTFKKTHTSGFRIQSVDKHNFAADNTRFPAVSGDLTYSVVAGDIDGDGDIDVITGNDTEGLKAWLSNASALQTAGKDPNGFSFTLATTTVFPAGTPPGNVRALALFDANGDTLPDLLIGFNGGGQEHLFINKGNGIFADETSSQATTPQTCAGGGLARLPQGINDSIVRYDVRDIDGNGKLDVLAMIDVRSTSGTFQKILRYWLNDGQGCFVGQPTDYTKGGATDTLFPPASGLVQTWNYAFGDVNGDGFPDMIAGIESFQSRLYINNSGVFVDKTVSNLPDGAPTDSANTVWWKYSLGSVLYDVNGDGFPDLITSVFNRDPNTNGLNNYYCGGQPQRVCGIDQIGGVKIYLNDQQGNFPHDDTATLLPQALVNGSFVSTLPLAAWGMDIAKLSVNGPVALIVAPATEYGGSTPSYILGTPLYNGTQTAAARLLIQSSPGGSFSDLTYPRLPNDQIFADWASVKFVDLDGDGFMDIVIGDSYSGQIKIWQNTGTNYFIDVTSTALFTTPIAGQQSSNRVNQIVVANLDQDSQNLPDLLLVRDQTMRILINHSNKQTGQILLTDESDVYAGQPQRRLPSPSPGSISAVVANFDCLGGPDIFYLGTDGSEHLLTNTACLTGQPCGFFNDVTNNPGQFPPPSRGSQCIGTDCLGNVKALPISYDSANTDIFIARNSTDGTVRPHRLLKNQCNAFADYSQANWAPLPSDNDKAFGATIGSIFPRAQGDLNQDILIFNQFGPRVYKNSP